MCMDSYEAPVCCSATPCRSGDGSTSTRQDGGWTCSTSACSHIYRSHSQSKGRMGTSRNPPSGSGASAVRNASYAPQRHRCSTRSQLQRWLSPPQWLLLLVLVSSCLSTPQPAAAARLSWKWRQLLVTGTDSQSSSSPEQQQLQQQPSLTLPGFFAKKWHEVFSSQWSHYREDVKRLRVAPKSADGADSGAAVPVASHVLKLLGSSELLNPAQMARSLAYLGGAHRLRRVVSDLVRGSSEGGRGVKISVLGGSISWGSAVSKGVDDWFTLVVQRLQEVFPAANITGRNGCVPATPSSFMNMCLEHYLEDDVDLVFLEYATNDGWDINNEAKKHTYERLMRKVLNKQHAPAVVLVQLPTVGQAYGEQHPGRGGFARTVEDVYGVFAAYYDTPYLSFRNAIWRLARHHHYGVNFTEYYGYNYDFIHPLVPGHRAIADMVLYALQRVALGLETNPWSTWDESEVTLPLPDPMFDGNYEEHNRLCSNGEAFASVVTKHEGWDLINEGDSLKQKWGFVTRQAGSELVIQINTTRETKPEEPRINVQLAYLKSYIGMGMAVITCGNGCSCEETKVDAHHTLHQSTIYLLRLQPTQAPQCQMRVKVLEETSSPDGGHKFKVTGVMANEFTGNGTDSVDGVLNNEEWLGIVNKAAGGHHTHHHHFHKADEPGASANQSDANASQSDGKSGQSDGKSDQPATSSSSSSSNSSGPQLPEVEGDAGATVHHHRAKHLRRLELPNDGSDDA